MTTSIGTRLLRIIAGRWFFIGVMALFVMQAVWVAVSAAYPMAFDEEVHMGTIRLYAQQLLPVLGDQPGHADSFGAVFRDPSYLYHYLMSFPYRILAVCTDSEPLRIVALRLINVALFAYGLVVFRRFAQQVLGSAAISTLIIAVIVLVPIVPLLAGQVNYDNLLMVCVAWLCVLAFSAGQQLHRGTIPVIHLGAFVALAATATVVKYAAIPIVAGLVLYMGICWWRGFGSQWRQSLRATKAGWRQLDRLTRVVLVVSVVVCGGLMVERYGVNTVVYHHPIPSCEVVLDETRCSAYGPWYRNHLLAQQKVPFNESPLYYAYTWSYWLWHRLYFAVNGPVSLYATRPPLPLPWIGSLVIAVASVGMAVVGWRTWRMSSGLLLCLCVASVYLGALYIEDYSQYLETGQPVAINGRYLLPIMALLLIMGVYAWRAGLTRLRARAYAPYIAAVMLVVLAHGGGMATFILRSDSDWYWQQPTVMQLNQAAQRILSPITIEGEKYYK